MSRATNTPPTSFLSSGYSRYGVILFLILAIRLFDLLTDGTTWRAMAYGSMSLFIVVCTAALLICALLTNRVRTHLPAAITILLSGLAGAAATLLVSSIPGMAIGLTVGTALAFDRTRRYTYGALSYAAVVMVPAMVAGLAIGFFGSMSMLLRVDPSRRFAAAAIVVVCMLVLSLVWAGVLVRRRNIKTVASFAAAAIVFFMVAMASEPLGIQLDTGRRIRLLDGRVLTFAGTLVPIGPEIFVRGLWDVTWVTFVDGLGTADAEQARAFRDITGAYITNDGKEFRSAGFQRLDLRRVINLHAVSGARVNDEALLSFANCADLIELTAPSSEVTDAGLRSLAGMPKLVTINLSGTTIDGSGLKYLHRRAPLNMVFLGNTQVDDEAVSSLAPWMISHLDLRGTRVRGASLGQLDVTSLEYLNLAHAGFQEEYIDSIPPTINRLILDGTELTQAGVAKLAALTTVTPMPMFQLSITDSGVDDDAVQPLKNSNITELRIDATRLTPAACDALAHIEQVELVYEASAMSLDDITMRYDEMRQTLLAVKKASGIPLPSDFRREPTLLGIRNLKVEASLLPLVKGLRDCTLYDVQIAGRSQIEPRLEPTDLDRFFTPRR